MFRVFRQLRKKVIGQENVRKYFWYALGEVLLVMIGILLALQVNNWNEERKMRERETAYLNRLFIDLERDAEFFELNIDFYEQVLQSGTNILFYAESIPDAPVSKWDLLVDVFHASQIWPVIIESSTFEELKSAGELSIIRETDIRNRLSYYYGGGKHRYENTIAINPEYRKKSRMLLPYPIQDYMWDQCHETVTDIQVLKDCQAVISEEESEAILDDLISNTELMGELAFFMSAIRAGKEPLNEQRKLSVEIMNLIKLSLGDS